MASGRNIKGITVEIGGDTTGLQKALSDVNKEITSTQSQLKDVEKLLKLDPGNTELLSQKYRLLGEAVQETKDKLATLQTAAEQANTALAAGTISQDQYDALQREIIETTQRLEELETQAEQSSVSLQSLAATGSKLSTIGDAISSAGEKLMPVTETLVSLGKTAVTTAADFESAMSEVEAVSGASAEEMEDLSAKAREMGESTKFSATEAAEAMNYMAMAGWKSEQMISGIEGIMNLAAASGEDLGTVSDIVTDALTAFGLTAEDSGHFADVLAAASSNANTDVSMMGETFKYAASVAGALGYSVEDTAEAIGLMANAGIKSSQAGTALRSIMNSLQGDITIVGQELGEMTVSTTNADGSMKPLSDTLAELRVAFDGLTESEAAATASSLVGQEAMSAFLSLMSAAPEDVEKLSSAIDNCDGASADMAATMQDNLNGQITILKSQLEELAISAGEILMPLVQKVVGFIQNIVDWLNQFDEKTQQTIIVIAAIAAAVAPVLIVVGKVVSAIGTIMTILPTLATVIGTVKTAFVGLTTAMAANPIGLIVTAIAALVAAFIYLWNNCEEFRQFWIDLWEGIKTAAITVWETLKTFLPQAWDEIKETAISVWSGIKDFFSGLWEGIVSTAQSVWGGIKDFFGDTWEGIKQAAEGYWELIKNAILGPVLLLIDLLTGDFDKLKEDFINICENIAEAASNIWQGIYTAVSSLVENLVTAVVNFFISLGTKLSEIWTNIWNTVSTVWNNIKTYVVNAVENIKNSAVNAFEHMRASIKEKITNIKTTIVDGFKAAIEYIQSLPSQAKQWGADLIDGIINGIKSAIGKIKETMSNVAETIRSYLHFSTPDVGPLTDYESWMPDFMQGLANGIEKSRGLVQGAMRDVASDMVISPTMAGLESGQSGAASVMQHTGTIRVEGVNDAGTLTNVVDIIIDQLRQEVRT